MNILDHKTILNGDVPAYIAEYHSKLTQITKYIKEYEGIKMGALKLISVPSAIVM